MRFVYSVILVGCLWATAGADIIRLTDGTMLEGDVKKNDDGWVVTTRDGKTVSLKTEQVTIIQKLPSTKPAAQTDKLGSLRRAMDNATDLQVIIDRYQKFIDQATDEPTKKAAQDDLAMWKHRQEQGLVKFGNQWIAAGDKSKIQEQALALALQGRDYIKQGRLKEAEPILQQALATDPGCASAMYLRGLLLFRQDQFAQSRKAFEAVLTIVPDHVATLNDLAITIGRQNQIPAALNQYDRAMMVSPQNKLVLTNIAEVLEALPEDLKKNEIVRRVQKRFDEQVGQLEVKEAAAGRYRWGATWVTAADLDKLKAVEAQNKAKLDALSVDYDAAQADLTRIDQTIADEQNALKQMEANSVRYDVNGQLVQLPYPPAYYDIQRDIQKMIGSRATDVVKMEQLRTLAKAIQQQLPTPRYTGVQQLIGIEGTPVAAIDSPATTGPSTQPAQ